MLGAKLALAGGLFYWMFAAGKIDPADFTRVRDHWHWLLLAQVPFAGTMVLGAWRWSILLRAQGIERPLKDMFALTVSGVFFNQVMLGSTGGDLYRALVVARDHREVRDTAIVSVFVDRVIGLLTLMLIIPLAAVFHLALLREHLDIWSFVALVLCALTLATLAICVFLSRRLRALPATLWIVSRLPFRELMARADQAILSFRSTPATLVKAAGISLLIHSLVIATNVALAHALTGGFNDWSVFMLLIPLAHVTMALPVNPPGALGTAEAIYAHLFAAAGFSAGATLALLQRLTYLTWSIPGALFYVVRKTKPAETQVSPKRPS